MSSKINPNQGNIVEVSESSSKTSCSGRSIAITALALVSIGLLVAGGLAFYFHVNTVASTALMGAGGTLGFGSFVAGVRSCYKRKPETTLPKPNVGKQEAEPVGLSNPADTQKSSKEATLQNPPKKFPASYSIVTWNVGTQNDYGKMCFIDKKLDENKPFSDAFSSFDHRQPYPLTNDDLQTRKLLFQDAFQSFGHPDFLCLQETWEMKSADIKELLPEGYDFFGYESNSVSNCVIAWDSSKFTKIKHLEHVYRKKLIPSQNRSPDTIVLLEDTKSHSRVCINSAHLRGFSLAKPSNEMVDDARSGDNQAKSDLSTMQLVTADLYLFAGDFNVTRQHYPQRLGILEKAGYITDLNEHSPTIYDGNLKEQNGAPSAVKLDHIYAKGSEGSKVRVEAKPLEMLKLNLFDRPSDHLPIGATVSISY